MNSKPTEIQAEMPPMGLDIPIFHGIVELWRIARRRKWHLLLGLAVGIGLGTLVYSFIPPKYESMTTILVERKRPRALPIPGIDDPRLSIFVDSLGGHQALLTSPLIAERAIRRHQLDKLETLANTSGREDFDPVKIVVGGLEVERETEGDLLEDPNIAIFEIVYKCGKEDDARTILSAVVDSYNAYLDEVHLQDQSKIRTLYDQWMVDIRKELREKEVVYKNLLRNVAAPQWQGANGENLVDQRLNLVATQRLELLVQVAEYRERLAALKKAQAEGVGNEVLFELVTEWSQVGEDPSNMRSQLFDLMLQEKALKKTYGPAHREVLAVQDQIKIVAKQLLGPSALEGEIELMDTVEAYIQSLEKNTEVTQTQADALEKIVDDEYSAAKLARVQNEEVALVREDITMIRELQKEIIDHIQELDVTKETDTVEARVLAPPQIGKIALLSNPVVIFGFSGLLGLILGGGSALLAESVNRSFRVPEEFQAILRLPLLGHVPYHRVSRVRARAAKEANSPFDRALITCLDPESFAAEAYRGLRSALLFNPRAKGMKSVQITSPSDGEGKSTVAANLAVTIAHTGHRVVLVDCDMRRAAVKQLFGLPAEVGFTELLCDRTEVDDALQPSGVDGLDVIVAGAAASGEHDRFSSDRFAQLIEVLKERYDYVLLDTPPLLAHSDASAVAAQVDGVVLAIANSADAQVKAAQAVETLHRVGANVIGMVVKGTNSGRGPGGFGYDVTGAIEYSNGYSWPKYYSTKGEGEERTTTVVN